ncbi:MAG: DUF2334 domain-containing protein [Vulcanimicrobiota bacterium]
MMHRPHPSTSPAILKPAAGIFSKLCISVLALIFLTLVISGAEAQISHKVLIIYDNQVLHDISHVEAVHVSNLIGHFHKDAFTADLCSLATYREGTMQHYPFMIFLGSQKETPISEPFLRDVQKYRGTLFWMGAHLETLPEAHLASHGLTVTGATSPVEYVLYRGARLTNGKPEIHLISTGKGAKILAWAYKGKDRLPYIVQSGSFWYIADTPFQIEDGPQRYLAFCDILHDFLGVSHKEKHQAVVRIEDVNPTTDPQSIISIADTLSAMKVPFLISLVPVYTLPSKDKEIRLSEKPELVKALHYAIGKGAAITLHGCTHQYRGASTIDSEFWDMQSDRPLDCDSALYVEEKLEKALDECFKCGIYPLLWTTPHYLASEKDYRIIARHFSTGSERKIFFNQYNSRQNFPFIIERDIYGQRIIPEYLTYVPYLLKDGRKDLEGEKKAADRLVATEKTMHCVRDSVAGFFFHPFMDVSLLKGIVTSMEANGCSFLDARKLDNRVTLSDKVIMSGNGTVEVTLNKKFLKERFIDDKGLLRKERISSKRLASTEKRSIKLAPGWLYVAEAVNGTTTADAALLWRARASVPDQKNQKAFLETFKSTGISVNKIERLSSLDRENILIVPHGSAESLSAEEVKQITSYVRKGGVLVFDGFSRLSDAFDLKSGGTVEVKGVKDLINSIEFFTSGPMEYLTPSARDKAVFQSTEGQTLAVLRKDGEGGLFFLSTLYDPESAMGYARFPTLLNNVLSLFEFTPPRFVPRIEAYFDPGCRSGGLTVEKLPVLWRKMGIRRLHVGMWHFYNDSTYDYKKLIDECHRRGIAVYAWLELPHYTIAFWQNHPEFREKNFQGKDVQNFWRYPLALEDDRCKKAVFAELDRIFKTYDFDGVNLAELYLENEGDLFSSPETLSPFHPSALKAFQDKYGFDMRDILSKESPHYWEKSPDSVKAYHKFREDLVTTLHRDFLAFLDGIRKEKKDFEVIVTIVDSLKGVRVTENYGVNSERIAAMMKDYPFTLVAEDPYTMWNLGPERYEHMIKAYHQIGVPFSRIMMNLNVVDIHKKGDGFASSRQTGAELYQMLRAASADGHRVVLYAESTILDHDIPYLGYVMDAPSNVIIPDPSPDDTGALKVTWSNGDILSLSGNSQATSLQYECPTACYVALTREPRKLWIDGVPAKKKVLTGDREWIVCLPLGKHRVKISTLP